MTSTDMWDHFRQSNMIEEIFELTEIEKSQKAWEYLQLCDTITEQNILDIHTLIMENLLIKRFAGTWRIHNVEVAGYLAPRYSLVPMMMDNWIHEFKHYQDLDPREVHIMFERIHPFVDGNGRTGRLLMWWHEMKLGKEPTMIRYNERHAYYAWFKDRYR